MKFNPFEQSPKPPQEGEKTPVNAEISEQKEKELTKEERELIKEIEKLPGLDFSEKTDLILVWRKLKPATNLNLILKHWESGEQKPELSSEVEKEQVEKIESLFSSLGIFFELGEKEKEEPRALELDDNKEQKVGGYELQVFYIASKQEDAKKLADAWQDQLRRNTELGYLFGFPKSPTEAFQKFDMDLLVNKEELPEDIKKEDFMAFAEFKLSKANWQQEIRTAKRWAEEIKKISPELYNKKVQSYKEQQP